MQSIGIRLILAIFVGVFCTMSYAKGTQDTAKEKLIPLSILFSDPKHTRVQISPDGKQLAYLAPHQGVLNVWVGPLGKKNSMHPVTNNKTRGIANYYWAYNNQHILYVDDNQGNEDWRIYRVDVKTGQSKILASFKKVQARIIANSQYFPDEILIGLNQRRPDFHDIYRLNIRTGKQTLVYENNNFVQFIADEHLNIPLGLEYTQEGGAILYTLGKDFSKTELFKIKNVDLLTTQVLGLNKAADTLYISDSRGRNTAALIAFDLNTQKTKLIAEDPKSDISSVLEHPTEKTLQAYETNYEKPQWHVLDNSIQADMDYLTQFAPGAMHVTSRSLDDKTWIVAYIADNAAPQYYYYDKPAKKAHFLFSGKPSLDKLALTKMQPVIIQSRDHLPLVSYLSLPNAVAKSNAKPKTPVPLVLYVHGGPNARDDWGLDPVHQWLTNRGYAVLSVNYRGSTGFGKQFVNAGNGEWGGKMHLDLLDAVEWAIKQGITTRDKVAILGGSYGGYATLIGLTKTPDTFACGVDIVGPSSLETLFKSIPDYWKPFYAEMKTKIGGDPETDAGRQFLASRSPLTFVDNIKKPLLIAQGANDPRVKQAESEQIVKEMQAKKIPVTYVLYPDEGHGFRRPENRLSFYATTEAFLAHYLGGKSESIQNLKMNFKNSSIEIKTGKEYVPGL